MDRVSLFAREASAFQAAAREAAKSGSAPPVPSCPGWSMSDLVLHLGAVQRGVDVIIRDRLVGFPDRSALAAAELPPDTAGWPLSSGQGPSLGPIPESLLDWFAEGAARLETRFRDHAPDAPVWTWSEEQTVGFWVRMQTIEAAVHRWDAENALGAASPIPGELAVDAVAQTFQVMAPVRRAWQQAPAGAGERYLFRRTDGPELWTVRFDGEHVRLSGGDDFDVELAGTASDLMLFLWQRIPADALDVQGDKSLLDRYFVLVPPI
ncbi:maleylpyruvate isomerase family mycothiol-dependent enzyme [Nonomuraea sp. NPDC049480]|uniref:maleylpyruvate isomerase family mycothiol-dependent enzyme n=1 Tax=Nonomuraea sp. NPDC049480 TaxID=3364353 RepID=UPI00379F7F20